MFSLSKQIHRDPLGIHCTVCNDQNLRRPRDHINTNTTENLSFGFGNETVTWSDNFIHFGNGLSAISQSSNRLSASDTVNRVNAGETGRRQDDRD
jgi:hypothetical protein